ncbi:helix-turn-helix transcriptional regulator [Candidatus Daviesbacteria bacterium]|nr:helix-turn-helix transcriptional regulator [Candidatus Daviesbacteria bacterium]
MRYTITMPVEINHKSQLEFGKKLREIREQRRLFQEDVAKSVGISITYYAGIERGEENPTFSVLEKICKVLKVKSSEILPF